MKKYFLILALMAITAFSITSMRADTNAIQMRRCRRDDKCRASHASSIAGGFA